MSLSTIQQERLLHWAQRFRDRLEADAKPSDQRLLEALNKIITECRPVLYPPVKVPPGIFGKDGKVD